MYVVAITLDDPDSNYIGVEDSRLSTSVGAGAGPDQTCILYQIWLDRLEEVKYTKQGTI